jgi:hypothetical protein
MVAQRQEKVAQRHFLWRVLVTGPALDEVKRIEVSHADFGDLFIHNCDQVPE